MGLNSGKSGGKNALAAKPNLLNALQVQTSSYGQVIPILYGQNRIAGRLLWSGDFQAIAHTSTQKVGGKGLGSSSTTTSQTTYTYQTAVAIGLCMGPIQNLGNVWDTKGQLTLLSTSAQFTVPGGGGSFTPTPPSGGLWHSGRGVSRADAYSFGVNDFGSDGVLTLSGTQHTPMMAVAGSPGAGQFALNPSTGQHTFSAADAGKVMTITYAYSTPTSSSSTGVPATTFNLTLFPGSRPQTPWSYLTSAHPGQDLGYNGIAYVASSAMDLGTSGALPNLSYEVLGLLPFGGGITDAEPGSIINDLLTNPYYGVGTQGNLVLDPGILSVGLSGSGAYWTQTDTSFAKGFGNFVYAGTGGASSFRFAYTKPITVTPGQQYTLSGYIDATQVTAGGPIWSLFDPTISTGYFFLGQTAGVAGVVSGIWTCPAGVTQVVVLCDTSNCTVNNGQLLRFARPWFAPGKVAGTPVMLDDYTSFSSYCIANGIFLSPIYDSQQTAAKCIQDVLDITNAEAVWSEGVLKLRSYGDTTAVGNGQVFSPATSPVYDLDANSFLSPVTVKRPSVAEVMNSVSVEFADRANSYNVAVAEDKDEAQIAIYGLRKAQPTTAHSITTSTVAAFVANLLRKRQVEIRNTYTIKLGWQYALLEPMDLITLTVPELGYRKKPVRITDIREDDSGQLEMDCEDFPWGTATPTLYAQQTPSRFAPQTNADPGNVNAPIIFEAPINLSKSGQHEIWMAVSGAGANWGGCSVWVSQDNNEYHQIGRINAPARTGVCGGSGTFGVTGDPYTGGVGQTWDFTQSRGVLTAGTQQDADSYRTLVYFDGEFMSYANLTLVSSNVYNPQGYIRRGLFGSTIAAHNVGSPVARLDEAIFTYIYDPSFLGKTIFLKFTSFNTNGLVEQSIANVSAYQFIVTGKFCQMENASKNLLANPGFESNQSLSVLNTLITSTQRASDNWTANYVFASGGTISTYYTDGTGAGGVAPHSGSRFMVLSVYPNGMANGAAASSAVVSDKVPVNPGEAYAFGGYVRLDNFGLPSVNSGLTIRMFLLPLLFDASGACIGDGVDSSFAIVGSVGFNGVTPPAGWQKVNAYFTVPATSSGRKPAFLALACYGEADNATGSTFSASGNLEISFDDLFLFPQWSPVGDEIAKLGSISVTYTNTPLSYNQADPTQITWSWNFNATRTDLPMSVNNYSGSQTVTGLTASTNYYYYPFIDEVNNAVTMVATGGVGSPSWAHTSTGLAFTQEQARGDHWPLSPSPVLVAQPASGGSSGSGGGGIGGVCLRHDVLVEEKSRGTIAVRDLRPGDRVRCPQDDDTPEGWAEVKEVSAHLGQEWVHTHFNCDDWLATTTGHPFTLEDGRMKRAAQLCFEDAVPWRQGITFPVRHEIAHYPARKVRVTIISRRHVFYAGMKAPVVLQHNFIPES